MFNAFLCSFESPKKYVAVKLFSLIVLIFEKLFQESIGRRKTGSQTTCMSLSHISLNSPLTVFSLKPTALKSDR